MTANVEVRGIARDYLWFVVVSPMLAVCAFGYDGVYIGATWARDMRNLMVLSLLIFFTAWFSLRSHGNAGLWGACWCTMPRAAPWRRCVTRHC